MRTLVAENQAELLGQTTYGTSRDANAAPTVGEVRSLFVRSSAWRAGVGTALMSRALGELAAMGFAEVTLWSFADNARANAFYRRQGFSPDGNERREEVWAEVLELRFRRLA